MEEGKYVPEEFRIKLDETKRMKKIRFAGDGELSDKASAKAVEILGLIEDMELSRLLKEYLEKLVRTLIMICRQGMGLQQNINDILLISWVDRNTDDLAEVFDHLEAMWKFNIYLSMENDE